MPKREKTPPPPEDEPRYVTVVHPYPLHANLQLHADRRALALWLACCTGKDVLLSMFHKPASPGMVIVEVDRDFDSFDSLLGKHDWSKFLLKPKEDVRDKASKVFWCTYNTGRLVEKQGWKRVFIEEHWFKDWSPKNAMIKYPYPKTTYCDVPSEPMTGAPLCRPLPKASFPAPPPPQKPTVGSPEWISAKGSDASSDVTSSSRRRGGKSAATPSDSVSVVSASSGGPGGRSARSPPPTPTSPAVPASLKANDLPKQGVWNRGPPSISSIVSPPASRAPSTVGSRAYSARGSALPRARPPGLTSPSIRQPTPQVGTYERFNWSDEVDRFQADQDEDGVGPAAPSGTSASGSVRYNMAPRRHIPVHPEGPIDAGRDYDYYEEDVPKRTTAAAMTDLFGSAPRASSVRNNARLHDSDSDYDYDYDEDVHSPWNGYDAPRWEPPTKINIKIEDGEKWECPQHGPLCNPGICVARADVERRRRKQKEHDDRMEAIRERKENWEKRKLKKEQKLAELEGREIPLELPPHLVGTGPRRGDSAVSSDSDVDGDGSHSRSNSPEPPPPPPPAPVSLAPGGRAEDKLFWDEEDDMQPVVSLARRAKSIVDTEGGDDEDGLGEGDDARSIVSSAWTTSSRTRNSDSDVSQSTLASGNGRPRAAATFRTATSSTLGNGSTRDDNVLAGAKASRTVAQHQPARDEVLAGGAQPQSPPLGQRQPARDARNRNDQPPDRDDVVSVAGGAQQQQLPSPGPGLAQRPPEWDRRSSATSSAARSSDERSTSGRSYSGNDSEAAAGQPQQPPASARIGAPAGARARARARGRTRGSVGRRALASSTATSAVQPEGGFPTFAHTSWGDPIALAQSKTSSSSRRKSSSAKKNNSSNNNDNNNNNDNEDGASTGTGAGSGAEKAGGDERSERSGRSDAVEAQARKGGNGQQQDAEPGSGTEKKPRAAGGHGQKNNLHKRVVTTAAREAAAAAAAAAAQVALPLDVELPRGGPGSSWGDPNAEW